jgi:hypothetical protein
MDNDQAYDGEPFLGRLIMQFICLAGDQLTPHLHQLCRVTADLTDILTEQVGSNGQSYWQLEYEVAVLFGGTKLQARLQWCQEVNSNHISDLGILKMPQGQVHSGPVTVFHKSTIC